MAQKTKVKELVGRGLHSYHTKALQQMDRIEKKNKEQNHKISILSNELDNDYLTKTEEGSVISLEHSKEGMVYLDELQGNTLVNYCTDGSKELTLNGDIDVEGTFVTTTEGVDNGKVDVMCEGNTLVNCIKDASIKDVELIATTSGGFVQSPFYALDKFLFKPNTVYTFVALLKENTIDNSVQLCCSHSRTAIKTTTTIKTPLSNTIVFTFTTKEDFTGVDLGLYHQLSGCTSGKLSFTQMILEGDWTNKEIPPYFEGMKSVGQDDENGHKIEISSSVGKENLIKDSDIYIEQSDTFKTFNSSYQNIIDKVQNKTITISVDIEVEDMIPRTDGRNRIGCELSVVYEDDTRGYHGIWYTGENFKGRQARTFSITKKIKTIDYFGIYIQCAGKKHKIGRPKIEIGDTNTNWCPSSKDNLNGLQTFMNKKEILMNEPLRGLPNGIKDRFVKIGGKWFIERNCAEKVLNGTENWLFKTIEPSGKYSYQLDNLISTESLSYRPKGICDKYIFVNWNNNPWEYGSDCISILRDGVYVYTGFTTVSELKTWIQSNPITLTYELETPIYEPLEIEPTLNTYNDITHISNNSIIPCNMKIQNSGYNAIIKPSTLYTVALDTNKSGTVGIDLGGMKTVTTNNVVTITTPAILSDDSLRLFGKGIKGSKVRLLEGDKTNWIPSYFEGMKSCFEDKLQDDGTYKMEILSNNKNLLDEENIVAHANITSNNGVMTTINFTNEYGWFRLKLKNTYKLKAGTYYLQFKMRSDGYKGIINEIRFEDIADIKYLKYSEKLTNPNCNSDYQIYEFKFVARNDLDINYLFIQGNTTSSKNLQLKDFILSRIETVSYESNKSNKIQFSSIEPLRGVGDIKDKFVFKDNKLMIQRNCKQIAIQNSDIDTLVISNGLCSDNYLIFYMENLLGRIENDRFSIKSNKFATRWTLDGNSKSICEGIFGEQIIGYSTRVYVSIDKKRLTSLDKQGVVKWLVDNKVYISYLLEEPTYEEIPFELQKIILEGYENGTLFFDTNIPPTSTVIYAGETPIVKSVKLNKTEVLNNTEDINDNIIPYLMDMDYRVVMLQLATEELEGGVSMARLFGGTYEMIKRDILSKRLTREEYGYRLADYFNVGKLTEEQVRELEELR